MEFHQWIIVKGSVADFPYGIPIHLNTCNLFKQHKTGIMKDWDFIIW